MKDVFYTLLAVWLIWKVVNAFGIFRSRREKGGAFSERENSSEGKTSIRFSQEHKRTKDIKEGEYVEFEEIE